MSSQRSEQQPRKRRPQLDATDGSFRIVIDPDPIAPGQVLTGPLFSEPMRVETVIANGPTTWVVGLVGVQSERFRKVTLTVGDLEERMLRDVDAGRFRAICQNALEGLASKTLNLEMLIERRAQRPTWFSERA